MCGIAHPLPPRLSTFVMLFWRLSNGESAMALGQAQPSATGAPHERAFALAERAHDIELQLGALDDLRERLTSQLAEVLWQRAVLVQLKEQLAREQAQLLGRA